MHSDRLADVPEHIRELMPLVPNDYGEARAKAWDELQAMDPQNVARAAGVPYVPGDDGGPGRFLVTLLDEIEIVDLAERKVFGAKGLALEDAGAAPAGDLREVFPFMAVLPLHYLAGARDIPVAGEWISFRELDAGEFYFPAFSARTTPKLLNVFGESPELLSSAAERLGGKNIEHGDAGVSLPALPKVPVGIVVWRGEEGLPPAVTMLYDKSAPRLLATEDLAVLGAVTAGKLVKLASTG
jgi:hypothetical protein